MIKTNKEWALYYQSIGLSIIPTGANKKSLIEWKPYQDRCATVEEINNWWNIWPDANPTLVTGRVSGVVALDLDKKHNRSSKEFNLPPTPCAKSGNFGEHFFFKYPTNISIKSRSAISGDGVDCRGDGGYILLAPSINENGGTYEWTVPFETKDELAEIPEWFKKLMEDNTTDKKWLQGKDGTNEGSRNDTAASMAGKILTSMDSKLWESLGWEQLMIHNNKNTPPLSEKELMGVWKSIKKSNLNNPPDKSKLSQANMLLENIFSRKDVVLFHDEQDDGYISLEIGGCQMIKSCRSNSFTKWISNEVYKIQEKTSGSEIIKSILAVIEGKACFEGPKIKLQNRVAWHDNELWYDFTNDKWQAVKINKDGWSIIDKPPIIFNRYPHHRAQVVPVANNGDVNLFLNYINISNPEHRLLFLVFLVSCFIPDFPHVMLVVFGAQGSSKSTLSKLARLVVDPSVIEVASFPNSIKELIQAFAHHYFLFFDNVSHISEEQSDTLCKVITGGGHIKRELYKNDEDIIYSFMRCIGINGINLVTTRPDLLERSLLLELERIDPKKRKTEKELYDSFNKDLPSILGGIFDVLVKVINIQNTIKLNSHNRMADWTLWGCAIAEALGYSKEEFMTAYENNINRQAEMLLNENIVATTLFKFMKDKEKWKGTATELLSQLYEKTNIDYFEKQEKYWPKSAGSLSRRLNELSTYLKQMGILVVISTTGSERYIHISKILKKGKEEDASKEDLFGTDQRSDDTDDIPLKLLEQPPIQGDLPL